MSNWRDQLKKQTGRSGGSSAPTWREQLKKQSAGETAPVTSSAKNSSITELRDRYERTTGQELTPDRKAPVTGGISEGSEYQRGSVSDLRENFGRFEQEQPEAAAILKRLAEERAAREQKEQRSADMLFGVGAIRTPDGLQKRMEAQLMAEVPGGMSPFTSVDMDLAERSAMQRAINARANSMPHSVDTEYSIVEGAALDRDKIAAFEQMLPVPASASEEELNLWEKIKGRPEAQSDATRLALASYAANVGEAAASVEEASPLRRAEDLPAVFGAQVDDFRANTVDKLAEEVQANIARGTYSEIENQLTDVSIRMGLDALTMLATGGGSAGVQAVGGMSFVTNMARNPMFWTSFVQEYGSLYDEMTENGTDPQKAASVAAMAAAANSALEVGGGTEKMVGHLTGRLPVKKGWDLAKAVVQNGAEEALEGIIQDPVSNLAAKMTYDPYREVIDPEEIAKNAGMAFLVGGILGGAGYGGQAAVEKVGDAVYRRAETGLIGEMARETDGGAGMIRAAKESDIPELMELANEYEAQLRRGKALSDRQLAELYRAEESLDVIPKSATTEATTEARKATTEATTEEGQRTNVRASEPLYGSGEEFAAEEEKTPPAPRGVELSKAETNISSVRRADEAVKSFAQSLGEHGKAAFLAAEEVSGEAGGGRFAWQTYYNAGKWGKDMAWADQQNPAARALLVGDLTAEQAFKAGQMDAAEEMQSRAKKISQKGPGLVLGSGTAHVAPEVRSALDSIAKAFDAQIELMDMGDSQVRGAYNPSTGTIQLNTRTGFQGVMINVAKHEITHKLQDEAPEEYAAFKNYAASVIYERDGIAFEDLVQEQIDLYAERGIQISRSEAEDEVVANATEAFLRDEESIRKLCEKDRSLGQKILDAIRDVIRKIQKVLKGGELEQEAARLLSEDVEALKKAEELWLKAMAARDGDMKKASSETGEAVRYQLNRGFAAAYDAWDKKTVGGYFIIGTTSDVLRSIGVPDSKIYWDKSKIAKIRKEHSEMTDDVIKQVPQLLEDPIIVMQSNTRANRVVLLGELTAENGETVLAALELKPTGNRANIADFVKVASSHGRKRQNLQNLINNSDILYVNPNRKRTDDWLEARRLQLPVGLTSYGSIASVTYSDRDVNGNLSFGDEGGKSAMELAFEKADKKRHQLTPEARERGRLIRENERLKKANAHLQEGFKLTKGVEVSEADVEALAKKILKRYSSDADAGMLAEALRKVYRYIGNDVEPGWETVNEVLSAAAGKVLEDSREFDRSLWEETAEMRKRIRETPVYVDEAMRSEFALADGYQAFKRSHSRMFKIVNDPNAMSVDQLYTELAEDYPFMLDGEAVSAYDQLQEIADFIEASKPRWQNPFGENLEEMTAELVGEMYDAYFDLPQVKTFADKKQAEIDRMRMKHRAAMRELKEAETLKREELLETVKERYERRIGEMKDSAKAREARLKYEKWWGVQAEKIAAREAREKARDRRFISEQRRKIERKVKALSQALLNPTDMKSVPEGLRHAVQELVGALDMTGARGEDINVSKAWAELQAAVVEARADDGSGVILDPDLEIRIGEIVHNGLSLNEMNREQAEDLYRVLAALERACRDVRIELSNGRTMSATEAARGIIEDTGAMKPYQAGTVIERGVKNFFDYDLTDPIRFAERFGGYMQDLMQMLREGHDVQTRRWNEALDYTEEMFRKAKVWKWQEAKATEFELDSGEKISLNPAQVMELYLLSKREQALNHIYRGGITTKETTRKGKVIQSERVQVTVDDVSRIVQSLTAEQKSIADRMGYFMSHQASDWGNEVSMGLYGYKKFTERHYWPISSDANYTVSQMDGNVKDGTLAGLGMTKQTVKNASNPIMIGDAFDTYSKHITQMAAYSAFVPRLEQARLVINWKTSHDDNFRSTKEALERAGGKGATQYLEKFITDLNGRGRVERSLTERFIGASKAASIAGNMRVVVQQPTAYLRAAAEIDPKYLAQGLWGTRDTEEMKTYAPIARWKDWGFFEPGSGRQLSDLMIGKHDLLNVVSDAAMAPAGMMDNLTWGTLWNAVKAETQAKTDLEPGSEDFLQEVGRRFAEIVDRTQVVDSVFHRTQAMRSGNVLTKMSTAFMAEPLKSLNMITGEIRRMVQAKGFKAKAKAGAGLARNVTAFMASAILNAFVVAFVDAERDDDDEERYWEKYRQALFGEYTAEMAFRDRAKAFLSADLTENLNPLGMIPYVRDLMSMYQGYDIQRTDVQGIAELMDDLLKWGKLLNGESRYTVKYLTQETASSLSKVLGLPVANIIREVVSLGNLGLTIADGQGADTTWLRYTFAKLNLDMAHSSNKNTFVGFMLEARMAGNTELATRIFNDMIEAGWKNDELESAMTTRAKKLLEDQADVLDAYNAAEEQADAAGMEAAMDELLELGFTSAEIVKAAKSRKNSLEPEEEEAAGEQIGEDFWDDYGSEGASFDAGFLVTALVNGDQASAREAEAQLRTAGKTQKEIDSAAASELKKRIVQSMGYEKISELPEGMYLDMNTKEYRILHDRYGKTQFSFGDAALAYTGAVSIGYSQVVNDMIGMKYSTSAGEKVYTKDLIREKVTEKILDWYKKGRYDGSASREELTRWKNALDNLGISGEELEEKYRKYEKGKK